MIKQYTDIEFINTDDFIFQYYIDLLKFNTLPCHKIYLQQFEDKFRSFDKDAKELIINSQHLLVTYINRNMSLTYKISLLIHSTLDILKETAYETIEHDLLVSENYQKLDKESLIYVSLIYKDYLKDRDSFRSFSL